MMAMRLAHQTNNGRAPSLADIAAGASPVRILTIKRRHALRVQSLEIESIGALISAEHDLFDRPAATRIKSGPGFFRVMP
jgi:hypothetical protein